MPTYDHHGNRLDDLAYYSQQSESDFWWHWREDQERDPEFITLVLKGIKHLEQMAIACHLFDLQRLETFLKHQLKITQDQTPKIQLAARLAWDKYHNPPTEQ